MTTLRELLEKRANIWSQMQEMRDAVDKDGWTSELRTNWDRADGELVEVTADVERSEREAELASRFSEIDDQTRSGENPATGGALPSRSGVPGDATGAAAYREAFNRFCRQGMAELEPEQRQLLREHFDAELRAQGSTGSAGGYTVPEGFWAKVTETMKYFGGATAGATEISTSTGNNLPWPTNDDTSVEGYYLGENTQATSEGDLVFGQKALSAFTAVSGPVLLPFALAQDTAIDIEAFIATRMGERLGRRSNRAFTNGAGGTEPSGYMASLTTGKTTASSTAFTYDELIDLIHSVDAAYRASGRCQFKMHDLVLAYARKLRDDSGGAGVGRPLWEPSIQAGTPDTLLGYGYTINNNQDSTIAATKKTLAFGDFAAAFVVRRVAGGQMMRLTERYADYLQIGFIGFERHDSVVQDPSAVKVLTQKA